MEQQTMFLTRSNSDGCTQGEIALLASSPSQLTKFMLEIHASAGI